MSDEAPANTFVAERRRGANREQSLLNTVCEVAGDGKEEGRRTIPERPHHASQPRNIERGKRNNKREAQLQEGTIAPAKIT